MTAPLTVIGLWPGELTPGARAAIEGADVLAGGERLLALFPDFKGQKCPLSTPLGDWLARLASFQAAGRRVAVLTSGDPNFFGLAKKLLTAIPPEGVTILPAVTTVQMAFARLKTSHAGVEVASLHGRGGLGPLWGALYRAARPGGAGWLALYTDPVNTPAAIAAAMLGRGLVDWRLHVFEDLGTPAERVSALGLGEAAQGRFSPLNLAVLECLKRPKAIRPGLPEDDFAHEAGLITKREARAVALALLELAPDHVMWDLGAGSGSVAVEAAGQLPFGQVWAVEKNAARAAQIAANRAAFGAAQVGIATGEALGAIPNLPAPDRVFIGGGGAGLADIVAAAAGRLNPGGVVVAAAVTLDSLAAAQTALAAAGLAVDVTQVQIARSAPLGASLYLAPLNQVWLARGRG